MLTVRCFSLTNAHTRTHARHTTSACVIADSWLFLQRQLQCLLLLSVFLPSNVDLNTNKRSAKWHGNIPGTWRLFRLTCRAAAHVHLSTCVVCAVNGLAVQCGGLVQLDPKFFLFARFRCVHTQCWPAFACCMLISPVFRTACDWQRYVRYWFQSRYATLGCWLRF